MHEIVLHITMSNNHIGGGGDRVNGLDKEEREKDTER